MMGGNAERKVLIITIDEATNERLCEIREYALQSVSLGVLVLDGNWGMKIENIPPLGDVKIMTEGQNCARGDKEKKRRGRKPLSETKKEIFESLVQFRKEFGLGCFSKIADECGPEIDADMIRRVSLGDAKLGIDEWREISAAIQKARERIGSKENMV